MNKINILFCCIFGCISCSKNADIDKIFISLEKRNDTSFIENFKNTPEDKIFKGFYYPFKDEFLLISEETNVVEGYFKPVDIYNNDDQACIIFVAWHRKLNSKPLGLENLIQEIVSRNKNFTECIKKKRTNAETNFNKLNIGEAIILRMPVRISDGIKSTVYYDCPTYAWKDFNKNKDLTIKGKLIEKISEGNPEVFFLKLKIMYLDDSDTRFFYKVIKKSDTITIDLNDYGMPID
jgi:hypothetical protein